MKRELDAFTDETFDLCILGGGITGAGVALDAASRGWRVALIDRGDFASGTSAASSKLVHGGLRYLEYGHFPLVHEALAERGRLLRNAPHLVRPLPFLLPFYEGQRLRPWQWQLGLTLYDALAGRENIARSQTFAAARIRAKMRGLRPTGLLGGALYHDALMDDARLCIAVLQTASDYGAVLANYVEAVGFECTTGTITAVEAVDRLTGRQISIRCRAALNATGPWADDVCRRAGDTRGPYLTPTKGVHVILPDVGHRTAVLLLHPADGRVFFVIPWYGKTLIGTTDTAAAELPDALRVETSEVDYLLAGYNHYFRPAFEATNLLGAFAGLRPLVRAHDDAPSARSREFHPHVSPTGLVSALGGKYTTYRQMAETLVNVLGERIAKRQRCRTRSLKLVGTPKMAWPEFVAWKRQSLAGHRSLDQNAAEHLIQRYGDRVDDVLAVLERTPRGFDRVHPAEPDLVGEADYQRFREMAMFPADLYLRRSRVGMWRSEMVSPTPARP